MLNEDSNLEHVEGQPRRSMSQPVLNVEGDKRTSSTSATQQQVLSGAFSSADVRSIPIIQTWEENKALKTKITILRGELQMYQRRYSEAKEASQKRVKEVMDDYVDLKLGQENVQEKMEQYKLMEEDLLAMQSRIETSEDNFARQMKEFEAQKHAMEERIKELELSATDANNTTVGSFRGTLDDILKKNDPDFTLTSGYEERKINDLEAKLLSEIDKVAELEDHIQQLRQELDDQSARLADSENVRAQLEAATGQGILGAAGNAMVPNSTFMIGNGRESQTRDQLNYIDDLETKLADAKKENDKARQALVEYMNKCSKLEHEIRTMVKNSTFDSSSMLLGGQTSDELKIQIGKVNGELNVLRAENRELRIRCDQLTGGDGNLSISLGQSRLMAGIATNDVDSIGQGNETGGTSMRILPRESQLDDLEESKLPLMDTSSAVRNQQQFASMWEDFESVKDSLQNNHNDTLEGSFNSSMPPPGRDATQSFLSQKSFKNSPIVMQKPKSLHLHLKSHQSEGAGEQIQNNSFSTKTASPHVSQSHIPILHDMQQILDSSAMFLEGQHDVAVNVEQMQEKMSQIREALARLFERLKSSAALFEEILERMGSSDPNADKIKKMKLAFETSINDKLNVSAILEAAEKDLHNMSLNFSILEKSIVSQAAEASRRFTIAPDAEDVASSSLLNASYSPLFKFTSNSDIVEKLQNEVSELKNELEMARTRDMRSPLNGSSGRLSDVQINTNRMFEDLEVSEATLQKAKEENSTLKSQFAELEANLHQVNSKLGEVRCELNEALARVDGEQETRVKAENALEEARQLISSLKHEENELKKTITDMGMRLNEAKKSDEFLKSELSTALEEEKKSQNLADELSEELNGWRMRTKEAENKVEHASSEKSEMLERIVHLETEMEKLSTSEIAADYCSTKMTERKKEIELAKYREDFENAAIVGLERISKEISELTKKTLKAKIIPSNISSIQLVCDELCRRLSREREQQHEYAKVMRDVNEKIEKLQLEKDALEHELKMMSSNNENVPPVGTSVSGMPTKTSNQKCAQPHYTSPTRQLLHESTMAVDAIVQKLKKTHNMSGMGPELKETIGNVINESRVLRDFLHQKLILFKGIDMSNWKNETVDQLITDLGQLHQDNLMLEEQIKKYKKELKLTKSAIPTLGVEFQDRIKTEIGKIATDMGGAVKEIRKK